ncbi:nucleotide exchange factor GrpE [Streptomyces sp. NPDC058067]|uniref:nucleotide exchange factor GrpE n=1 Tax=Streptomyces sp. NPDC058067 TaxID=3346324 RepID=UPI0036DFE5A9
MAVREVAVANVLRALLPVLDAVDRTWEREREPVTPGLKDITDALHTQLGALGLESFGEKGDAFDPAFHDAVAHHVSSYADRLTCARILSVGYRVGETSCCVRPRWRSSDRLEANVIPASRASPAQPCRHLRESVPRAV